jgi:hypothetical protein
MKLRHYISLQPLFLGMFARQRFFAGPVSARTKWWKPFGTRVIESNARAIDFRQETESMAAQKRKTHYAYKTRPLCGIANPTLVPYSTDVTCKRCKTLMRYLDLAKLSQKRKKAALRARALKSVRPERRPAT